MIKEESKLKRHLLIRCLFVLQYFIVRLSIVSVVIVKKCILLQAVGVFLLSYEVFVCCSNNIVGEYL